MMRTFTSLVGSALLLSASSAFADDAPHVVSARVLSYERAELLTQKVCALVGVAEVGGYARLFDISIDGRRCSPLAPESDSVPLRVRIEPEMNGFRNVVFESDVAEGASAREMNAAVDGAARELYEHLGAAPPPERARHIDRHIEPRVEKKQPTGGYVEPTIVPYEGGAIPADAKIVTQPNIPVLATGASLFVASYGGALIYALSTCGAQEACRPGSSFLYIPFIGPLITAAARETPTTGGRALAAFDGGVQILGGALALASFVWPKKFVLWQNKSASVQVTPTTLGAGTSAGVAVTVTHF
ncbi:MAG TPA: hypothetical protein VGH87_06475 [Polyangiaceae bacterium]